jgi:hypothetical protein
VDVDRLKVLIAKLPNLQVFTDNDQGHGWNEAAVHRQLEVLKAFFGNCHGSGHQPNGQTAPAQLSSNGASGSAHGRASMLDTVTIPLSPA